MKNIVKKTVVFIFSTMLFLTAYGMLDSAQDRNVKLSDNYDIMVRESVKKFIEEHSIPLQVVADLYSVSIKNPWLCSYDGKMVLICDDKLIEISILKSDHSILNIDKYDNRNQG